MEDSTTNTIAIIGLVISVASTVIAVINHTRIKSMCCGKKIEMSIDISKTQESPAQSENLKIKIPGTTVQE
jgi:hypothetical protein